ncbi:MAG: PDZ domain-containing protein, partial [Planctomycetia bacterium]
MNRNKNHKTFIATILFTCLVGLAALSIASAQIPDLFSNDTEVLVYGDEQAIVNAITEKNKPQKINKKHQNELDHVFFILLRRAHPKPKPERLLRHTINAMCRKIENITKTKVPDSQRNTWITTATQANGFQTVLESMANFGSKKTKQKELIDTGISAMLRATGCSYATVLSKNRAKQITDMLQKRNTPNQNPKTLGIDVSKWPIIKTIPGTPATVAGLKDGDVILKANNKEIAQKEEILKILRAKRNTSIRLTVKRKNKILTFEVYRDPAAMMVKARVVDQNIVYIKIPLFEGSGIAGRVKKLIHEHVTDTTQAII